MENKLLKILIIISVSIIVIGILFFIYHLFKLALFNKCYMQPNDSNFNYGICKLVEDY